MSMSMQRYSFIKQALSMVHIFIDLCSSIYLNQSILFFPLNLIVFSYLFVLILKSNIGTIRMNFNVNSLSWRQWRCMLFKFKPKKKKNKENNQKKPNSNKSILCMGCKQRRFTFHWFILAFQNNTLPTILCVRNLKFVFLFL